MENTTITWLDLLPTEILFLIFEYLSNNEILYTFFNFSERLNNLLLQNQRYLTYFELPIINSNEWKQIVPLISSQIECLNIKTIYLSFPLKFFPNLKSIIISSPYGLADEELKSIIESEQFQRLESFKIKENQRSWIDDDSYYHNNVLKKVFTNKTSLKIFQYSLLISQLMKIDFHCLKNNDKLNSLTLILSHYKDLDLFLQYTPNLKYLNVQILSSFTFEKPINKIDIHLKEFYLKLGKREGQEEMFRGSIDFDLLKTSINQFSSSLICLSLDLSHLTINKYRFNGKKLQQFLETMKQLKQFHFYAKLDDSFNNNILLEFKNEYWFDHHWSFGMHRNYFYT
jgi:hypothetical protein